MPEHWNLYWSTLPSEGDEICEILGAAGERIIFRDCDALVSAIVVKALNADPRYAVARAQ